MILHNIYIYIVCTVHTYTVQIENSIYGKLEGCNHNNKVGKKLNELGDTHFYVLSVSVYTPKTLLIKFLV